MEAKEGEETIENLEELGLYELEYPVRFKTYSFGENEEFALASDEVQLDYTALTNKSAVLFFCKYDALKYMLKYLMDFKDPMIYSTMKLQLNDEGIIEGEMILEQYAIAGGDRKLDDVKIDPDIDDMKIRGVFLDENNENGVFGSTHIDTWEELEDEEGQDGENTDEVTGDDGDGAENADAEDAGAEDAGTADNNAAE
ncbi:MAG: hypothetical protein K6G22_07975 [Lachnospiraceae bacterium]|nr:hypothetical protein [Lachnospiraceae bacterium]